ncbi:MAG TPA: hypothetical protein VGM94_08305 [Galbitalea sp.]|jgi:hypothetical protein
MKRAQTFAIGLIAAALAGGVVAVFELAHAIMTPATGLTSQSVSYAGYYDANAPLWAGTVRVPNGTVTLGYSADVVFESSNPRQRIVCQLVGDQDTVLAGAQGYTHTSAARSGLTAHVTYSGNFSDLPSTSLSLVCHPAASGQLMLSVTHQVFTALPRR